MVDHRAVSGSSAVCRDRPAARGPVTGSQYGLAQLSSPRRHSADVPRGTSSSPERSLDRDSESAGIPVGTWRHLFQDLRSHRLHHPGPRAKPETRKHGIRPPHGVSPGRFGDHEPTANPKEGRRALRSGGRRCEAPGDHDVIGRPAGTPPGLLGPSGEHLHGVPELEERHCFDQPGSAPGAAVQQRPAPRPVHRGKDESGQASSAPQVQRGAAVGTVRLQQGAQCQAAVHLGSDGTRAEEAQAPSSIEDILETRTVPGLPEPGDRRIDRQLDTGQSPAGTITTRRAASSPCDTVAMPTTSVSASWITFRSAALIGSKA